MTAAVTEQSMGTVVTAMIPTVTRTLVTTSVFAKM